MNKDKKIFIAYSWPDEDLVNLINDALKPLDITFLRDRRDTKSEIGLTVNQVYPTGSQDKISEFMKKVCNTDFIFIIISDSLLKSPNCILKIFGIIKNDELKNRILTIVLNDAKIYNSEDKIGYVKYWGNEYKKLEDIAAQFPAASESGLNEDLMQMREVKNNIAEFIDRIVKLKHVSIGKLLSANYSPLLKFIGYEDITLITELLRIQSIKEKKEQDASINKFIRIHPENTWGYFFKGNFKSQRKYYYSSILAFSRAVRLKPDFTRAFNNRGSAYFHKGKYTRSIKDFNRAIELNPGFDEAYNSRGKLYFNKHEYDKALEDYGKAIELKPDFADAYYNRGNLYNIQKKYDLAICDFNMAIELNPGNNEAYHNGGIAYSCKGDYDKAIECYNKAIQLKPDFHEAYNNRGTAYYNKKIYDRAIEDYEKAIALKPDFAEAYNNLGTTHYNMGDNEKAIDNFTMAIELKFDDAESYYNRGFVYINNNDFENAVEDFLASANLGSHEAKEMLKKLKEK